MNAPASGVSFTAGQDDDGKRIDRILRTLFPDVPLSAIYRALRRGAVRVNGRPVTQRTRVRAGSTLTVGERAGFGSEARHGENRPAPENKASTYLSRLIIYQSPSLLAVNKPYGMLVHGPGSLTDVLRASSFAPAGRSLSFSPGPVHRLDRNTTGVQLFSLSLAGARTLTRFFREHRLRKVYCGLVEGRIERPAVWEDDLFRDGQTRTTRAGIAGHAHYARTRIIPFASTRTHSLLLMLPETGRTHQLRFQAGRRGHPLIGDTKYGSASGSRYLLHNVGLAVLSGADATEDTLFPALVAPFDPYQEKLLSSLFGGGSPARVQSHARDLLSGKE